MSVAKVSVDRVVTAPVRKVVDWWQENEIFYCIELECGHIHSVMLRNRPGKILAVQKTKRCAACIGR